MQIRTHLTRSRENHGTRNLSCVFDARWKTVRKTNIVQKNSIFIFKYLFLKPVCPDYYSFGFYIGVKGSQKQPIWNALIYTQISLIFPVARLKCRTEHVIWFYQIYIWSFLCLSKHNINVAVWSISQHGESQQCDRKYMKQVWSRTQQNPFHLITLHTEVIWKRTIFSPHVSKVIDVAIGGTGSTLLHRTNALQPPLAPPIKLSLLSTASAVQGS